MPGMHHALILLLFYLMAGPDAPHNERIQDLILTLPKQSYGF